MIEWSAKLLGLPELASENGKAVDALIVYVHWLMLALFVGWVIYFGYAVWRFQSRRNQKADYEGVKSHASNYIELIVAAVEAILLVGVAIPVWAKAVDRFPSDKEATVVYVMAQQYAWNVRYAGQDEAFGTQNMKLVSANNVFGVDPEDKKGADDVQLLNEIHVPVNKPVIVYVSSRDVIHSFKVVAMRVCQDAIPGLRIPCWFTPTKEGRYQINCAQLCGSGHSGMTGGFLVVESEADFKKWMDKRAPVQTAPGGKSLFE
ncbi:MAG TPA: cytochrome c oxidase subunit II [Desulfuromonadaceae bacterium]|nr:cytochrome c oxidase subunit II [Desulfuromonadaceae bacterium]